MWEVTASNNRRKARTLCPPMTGSTLNKASKYLSAICCLQPNLFLSKAIAC